MLVVSYALMVFGFLFILVGVAGAAFKVAGDRGKGFAATRTSTVAEVVKAIPKLLQAIGAAPPWLGSTVVGLFLVFLGFQMQVGGWPFAHPPA